MFTIKSLSPGTYTVEIETIANGGRLALGSMYSTESPYDFVVGQTVRTWQEAEDWYLTEYGVHLVSLHDHDQNTAALTACESTNDCWIEAHRFDSDEHSDFEYTAWNEGDNWPRPRQGN